MDSVWVMHIAHLRYVVYLVDDFTLFAWGEGKVRENN